ncbi:MAG: radical SAM family heme chaperone HemW [Candidatus Cloacimonetes bacterium]|nr:radical SAM family heme chaperone HemW [Candidatus Cloacimonadota bacterium]
MTDLKKEQTEASHLYIHYPFCVSKCGYCSFFSKEREGIEADENFKTLLRELSYYRENYNLQLKTIYLGGGTPSLIPLKQLAVILSDLPVSQDAEITIEVNPGDVTKEKVMNWQKLGVNRISMGCQSMIDAELEFLGRRHRRCEIIEAVEIIKSLGINNLSLDLIYGLPNQSWQNVKHSLQQLVSLQPEHISTYCLSLEEGCKLFDWKNRLPEDEMTSDMYFSLIEYLEEHGFKQYELSSFSKPGKISRHNLAYWQQQYYLGCGPSAAGYLPGFRYKNPSNLPDWEKAVQQSRYFEERDVITGEIEEKEYIMLALRLTEGIDLEYFRKKFKVDFREKYSKELAGYVARRLMVYDDKRAWLCRAGYFISNEILCDFI